jgi:hypothetical protein
VLSCRACFGAGVRLGSKDFFKLLDDDVAIAEENAKAEANIVHGFGSHRSAVAPWLRRTGIEEHTRGSKKEQIHASKFSRRPAGFALTPRYHYAFFTTPRPHLCNIITPFHRSVRLKGVRSWRESLDTEEPCVPAFEPLCHLHHCLILSFPRYVRSNGLQQLEMVASRLWIRTVGPPSS